MAVLGRSFSSASRANFAATPLLRPARQNRHATQAMVTPISSWFNCVYQDRNLRTLLAVQWRPNSASGSLVWNESQDLFCLLEKGRFVLSWTLTFLFALLSPEVTCENARSLCYVGLINVELEGQICNKGFLRCSQQDKHELRMLGSKRPILLMSM